MRRARGLWIALASAVVVAAGAAFGLPQMRRRAARVQAEEAVSAAFACLFGADTPADPRWRRRRIAASLLPEGVRWPERCRSQLNRGTGSLRLAAIARSHCQGACCAGDRSCIALTRLLATMRRVESSPLAELSAETASQMIALASTGGLSVERRAGELPEPATMWDPNSLPPLAGGVRVEPSAGLSDGGVLPIDLQLDGTSAGSSSDRGARLVCNLPLTGEPIAVCAAPPAEQALADFPAEYGPAVMVGPNAIAGARYGPKTGWQIGYFSRGGMDEVGYIESKERPSIRSCKAKRTEVDDPRPALWITPEPLVPGQEALFAYPGADAWNHERVAVGAGAGFTCFGRFSASMLWMSSLGHDKQPAQVLSRHLVERVLCTVGRRPMCERARTELALLRPSSLSRVLVGDVARGIVLLYRGPLGEVRLRLAPVDQLAAAPDRPLVDDADYGGFGFELSAARLFVHDGVGVLLLPTIEQIEPIRMRIHALRIESSGTVAPYHL